MEKLQHKERADLVGTGRQIRQPIAQYAEQVERIVGIDIDNLDYRWDGVIQGEGIGGDDGRSRGDSAVVVEVLGRPFPKGFADRARGDATKVTLNQHFPRRRQQEDGLDHVIAVVRWCCVVACIALPMPLILVPSRDRRMVTMVIALPLLQSCSATTT